MATRATATRATATAAHSTSGTKTSGASTEVRGEEEEEREKEKREWEQGKVFFFFFPLDRRLFLLEEKKKTRQKTPPFQFLPPESQATATAGTRTRARTWRATTCLATGTTRAPFERSWKERETGSSSLWPPPHSPSSPVCLLFIRPLFFLSLYHPHL